ncbi:UNVERIFIED_CONTAM: Retrovirus-related Pol polyprotein from transposon RE2 [Sesamum angustifolium]|uniref:Retrovirus-related Pol polyprotein from transposon RE2 n=1 Tax=Sesamum angustifolium TaxID=2727405 RepID=A0AAW2J6U9_9LAMI
MRLVAKGYTQIEGVDYFDSFSLVAKTVTQASRQWNIEFTSELEKFGFRQSAHDYCLFIKHSGSKFTALLVYIDDVLLTGTSLEALQAVKAYLHRLFTIKDLDFAKYFLGLELARSTHGTCVMQTKYLCDILVDCHMTEAKPTGTPLPLGIKFEAYAGPLSPHPDRYRRLLSQFIQSPRQAHWDVALHLVRYLKGTPSLGLFFTSSNSLHLSVFSDSDWAACLDSRCSITGYCVFLGGALLSWKTKKQTSVSRSSVEAEYQSMGTIVCELLWINDLVRDFKLSFMLQSLFGVTIRL